MSLHSQITEVGRGDCFQQKKELFSFYPAKELVRRVNDELVRQPPGIEFAISSFSTKNSSKFWVKNVWMLYVLHYLGRAMLSRLVT